MSASIKKSLSLFVLVVAVLISSCSGIAADDITYLTPIPESTLKAYRPITSINNRLDAVVAAHRQFDMARLYFTQGEPAVVLAEKMTLAEATKLMPKNTNAVLMEDRPGKTIVWLVVFKGQWQVLPPASSEFLPVETGCIYVMIDVDHDLRTEMTATRKCIED